MQEQDEIEAKKISNYVQNVWNSIFIAPFFLNPVAFTTSNASEQKSLWLHLLSGKPNAATREVTFSG